MKKTLSIILITTIVVSSVIGVTAVISKKSHNTDTATNDVATTVVSTEASTVAQTESETVKPTQPAPVSTTTQTTTQDTTQTSVTSENSQDEVVMPQLHSLYQNTYTPAHRTIEVVNQNGNTLELLITSSNENYTKIATARASVTLENVYYDGVTVRGEGTFEYTDSFGNTGTASVSVSENVIILVIEEENTQNIWSIGNATGKYI